MDGNAAQEYRRRDVAVFPCWWIEHGTCACNKPACDSRGKHPIGAVVPNGVKDATTDAESIRAWPDQDHLAAWLQEAGWTDVNYRNQAGETALMAGAKAGYFGWFMPEAARRCMRA